MSDQCGSEYADYVFEHDESIQFGMMVDAAGKGDPQAKQQLKQAAYLASKEVLHEISDKCSYASLFFLAIGCPEVAAVTGAISMAADGLLILDEAFIEKNYKGAAIDTLFFVASAVINKKIGNEIKKVAGVSIKVGKNGHFYEIGKGPIKTAEGLKKLVKKDIADGVFGQVAPEMVDQIIDSVGDAFKKLLEENQIEQDK